MATASVLTAIVRADGASAAAASIHSVGSAIDSVGSKGQNFAGRMSTFGSSLTRNVSLPLVAIGGLAVKMAIDFDTSFARIQSLAGKTGYSMEQMKAKVIALGGATGQGPQELADALYFVASAGLKASQVFPVLEASAKGAEIGMGNVADIAQTLTSLLNAYAGTGLDAGNAMNIMTAAVKDGKAEMSDFATGLGPVIAVAANAGISFNELAAGIAQATNVGVPFDRAVTGMRFLISSLTNPTATATKALKDFGIKASDLAGEIKTRGLIPVLQDLYKKFQDGGAAGRDAWAKITGGARGSIVAVDLVGKHVGATNAIIRDTGNAAKEGATNFKDAFGAIVKNDPAIQFQKTFATLKGDLITLGNDILPFVTKALGFIDRLAKGFSNLSDGMQGNIIKFGAIAIAAGPVIRIFGGLIGTGIKVASMLRGLVVAETAVTVATGAMGASAAGAVSSITRLGTAGSSTAGALKTEAAAATGLGLAWVGLGTIVLAEGLIITDEILKRNAATKEQTASLQDDIDTVYRYGTGTIQGAAASAHFTAQLAKMHLGTDAAGESVDSLRQRMHLAAIGFGDMSSASARAASRMASYTGTINRVTGSEDAATRKAIALKAAIDALHDKSINVETIFSQQGHPYNYGYQATGGSVQLAGGGSWAPSGVVGLTRPTYIGGGAVAGEGGRETVVPENPRGAMWIKDAVRQGVVEAGGFGSGQTPIVYVLIDGQDLRAKVSHGDALRGVRS